MQQESWHVLHVVANHEKRVAQHLLARSLEHYLPLYSERSRWSDRSVVLERPLFMGYVFVRFRPEERVRLLSTPGVLRLLGDRWSSVVSAEEIDRIREGLQSGALLRPHLPVVVGTQVRVRTGIFAGVRGVVTELRRQCKVVLRMAVIEQSFSLEVALEDIEVLRPPLVPALRFAPATQ